MNNYKTFEVKDWIEDNRFQSWVFHGKEDAFWQQFLHENPLQSAGMETAKEILLAVRGSQDTISGSEVKQQVAKILDAIPEDGRSQWWKGNWLRFAAMLLLMSGIGFGLYENKHYTALFQAIIAPIVENASGPEMVEVTNRSVDIKLVNLPDGSSVVLKRNARITYPVTFAKNKREVSLSGEAFFEVVKNPAQPFLVYAGSMVTKVKGTSFSISANDAEDEVKLVVKTGVVEVSAREQGRRSASSVSEKRILEANEQVTFNQKSRIMSTKMLDKPVLIGLPVEKQDFEFRRTPLNEVFASLEKTYGVTIRVNKAAISNCTLTAKLGDEPVLEKLEMICAVVNAKYESRNGVVIITSEGCEY